jgi:hypothetical protein
MREIDDAVRWSNGRVVHDQFELSRQQKLSRVVAPFMAAGGKLNLAVCYQPDRGRRGLNCGRCEKCLRTATGLLVAGMHPPDAGIPVSAELLGHARRSISAGTWDLTNDEYLWRDIQVSIPEQLTGVQTEPGTREYLEWLAGASFVVRRPKRRLIGTVASGARYVAVLVARNLPFRVKQTIRRWLP